MLIKLHPGCFDRSQVGRYTRFLLNRDRRRFSYHADGPPASGAPASGAPASGAPKSPVADPTSPPRPIVESPEDIINMTSLPCIVALNAQSLVMLASAGAACTVFVVKASVQKEMGRNACAETVV